MGRENMGVKVRKVNIVTDSNGFFIRPAELDITKAKILAYVEEYHMPEDPEYSLDDLISDLADPDSIYSNYVLPNIKEDTQHYIEDLIDKLRDDRNYDIWKL
jgi:hypothetical protein